MMTVAELVGTLPQVVSARPEVAANLSIHGRGMGSDAHGITPIAALRAVEVPVAAGADDVRDPFNPLGRGDAPETELLAVRGSGVTDVIANAPTDRIVIHDGVVVSRSETRTWMAV
jgi:cytosine deaminase